MNFGNITYLFIMYILFMYYIFLYKYGDELIIKKYFINFKLNQHENI